MLDLDLHRSVDTDKVQAEAGVVEDAAKRSPENPAQPQPKGARIARIWAGSAISTIGMRTLGVAYPLLALAQTGSPAAAGLAGFSLTIPILVFYIPGGLLVDRISPRRVILFAEGGRWLAVLSVIVTMLTVGTSLEFLMVAAAVEGTMWVLYTLAESALLPSLVQPVMMQGTLAKREAASHIASLAGRPLGGYLFGVGRYVPFLINAVLFMASFGLFVGLRDERRVRPLAPSSLLRELRGGFRALTDQPFLGASIMLITLTNLIAHGIIMIFVAGSQGMPSWEIGLVLAASGVGGAVGSAAAYFHHPKRSVLLNHSWIWVAALALAVAGEWLGAPSLFFALAFFTTGFGGALSNVAIKYVEVHSVDPGTLARVVGVSRLISQGAICLAAPLGGLLVSWLGVTGGTMVLFVAMLFAAILFTGTRLRSRFTPPLPDLPRRDLRRRSWSSLPGELVGQIRQLIGQRRLSRGDRPFGEVPGRR